MNEKGKIKFVTSILIAGVFIAILGYVWFTKTAQTPTVDIQNQVQQTTEDPATADWITYRNEEYGIEFKHPNYIRTDEIKPSPNNDFLFEVLVSSSENGQADAMDMAIVIRENNHGRSDMATLKKVVMQWFGITIWPPSPWEDTASVNEFNLDNKPAIKRSYNYPSEDPYIKEPKDPAVNVYTLNSRFIYDIFYLRDIATGDQVLSTFKFTK